MRKKLSRDLGLLSVVSISTGAMVGAGIFVLPSIAINEAGPGAVLSFIFSGIIAFLAALAVCELATGMPKAGGSYFFLSRAMGSRVGSIAGWGSWIALIFKGAFALFGFGFYLSLFLPFEVEIRLIAIIFVLALYTLNIVGSKRSGGFQSVLLVGTLVLITALIATGTTKADRSHFDDFLPHGPWSVISTASLIFVSYIGIVKVSAMSEEIKDPDRNIPRGIIISSVLVIILYSMVVLVLSGMFRPGDLQENFTPLAEAGKVAMGDFGLIAMGVAGVLATASMANAAIMSSSRYPFAMSRDKLVPDLLITVNSRFGTPHISILLTCGVLSFIILFLNIEIIVEIASAFNILIFIMLNVAVLIMRRAAPTWYNPAFRVPGYPITPIAGIIGCLLIVVNYPFWLLVGTFGFLLVGLIWHYSYARKKVKMRSAVKDVALKEIKRKAIKKTQTAIKSEKRENILLLLTREEDNEIMLKIASALFSHGRGKMYFVRLKVFPSQTPLFVKRTLVDVKDRAFEDKVMYHARKLGLEIEPVEVITHSVEDSVIQLAEEYKIDTIFLDWDRSLARHILQESYIDHIFHKAQCDVLVLKNNGLKEINNILVPATTEEPFDEVKIGLISSFISTMTSKVTFLRVVDPESHSEKIQVIKNYLNTLGNIVSLPTKVEIVESKSTEKAIINRSAAFDLILLGVTSERVFKEGMLGSVADHVAAAAECSVMIFHRAKRTEKKMMDQALSRIAK